MEDLEKVTTKAYIEAKHNFTLRATELIVQACEDQVTRISTVIEEHKDAVEKLKAQRSDLRAQRTGYRRALDEKR